MDERKGGSNNPEAAEIWYKLSQENGKGLVGREGRDRSCPGPFSRTADTEQFMERGGRRAVSSVTGMGVEEAGEQVKLSGSCELALAPLPWAPLPAVLAQLSSTLTGPSHVQQGRSVL